MEDGRPLDRHSVASFFVSRVDTEVDKRLEALGRTDLQGLAGLANARAAYQAFLRVFGGERFAALREAGCPVQRPLWASTGVKNPRYPETLYVDGLVGPDTVNTMPLPTLQAAAKASEPTRRDGRGGPDGGSARARRGRHRPRRRDGPAAARGHRRLHGPDEQAPHRHRGEAGADRHPPPGQPGGRPARRAGAARRRAGRARARAGRRAPPVAQGRDAVGAARDAGARGPARLADHPREGARGAAGHQGVRRRAARGGLHGRRAARHGRLEPRPRGLPALHAARRRAPCACTCSTPRSRSRCEKVAGAVDMATTLFIVSSKSGGTIEPNALLAYFRGRQPDPRHFVAITDPGTSMAKLAESEGFRRTFLSDPEIGGRYSALSPFGIVPAALAGVDVQAVLEGAEVAAENCELPEGNSGLWLGAALGELARRGRDKLTFVVDAPLSSFGLWAEQLVAESTGKQKRGILPIADEPLADPSHYGPDRVFVHLRDADAPDPRHEEAMRALAKAGQADDRAHRERRQRPGQDLLPVRVRHRGRGLGAGDQPVRPAQRPGGQGQHHARAGRGRAGRPPGRRARGHPQRPGAAPLPGHHGLPALRRRDRRGGERAAGGDHGAPQGGHHLGLRPALPALHGPVPQGRAGHRALPPARARRHGRRRRCPGSRTRSAR